MISSSCLSQNSVSHTITSFLLALDTAVLMTLSPTSVWEEVNLRGTSLSHPLPS